MLILSLPQLLNVIIYNYELQISNLQLWFIWKRFSFKIMDFLQLWILRSFLIFFLNSKIIILLDIMNAYGSVTRSSITELR